MQIDRPCADRAASRHRDARRAEPGEQGRPAPECWRACGAPGRRRLGVAGLRWRRCTSIRSGHASQSRRTRASGRAWCRRRATSGTFVSSSRPELSKRGRNLRQDRVLRAADLHRAFDASAATNDQPIHAVPLSGAKRPKGAPYDAITAGSASDTTGDHGHGGPRAMPWVFVCSLTRLDLLRHQFNAGKYEPGQAKRRTAGHRCGPCF